MSVERRGTRRVEATRGNHMIVKIRDGRIRIRGSLRSFHFDIVISVAKALAGVSAAGAAAVTAALLPHLTR